MRVRVFDAIHPRAAGLYCLLAKYAPYSAWREWATMGRADFERSAGKLRYEARFQTKNTCGFLFDLRFGSTLCPERDGSVPPMYWCNNAVPRWPSR